MRVDSFIPGAGMQNMPMHSLVSASSSIDRIKVQGAVKSQMDGKAGVLRAEIKIDAEHGNVEKKMEELADIEAKAEEVGNMQMDAISDVNKALRESTKSDDNYDRQAINAENSEKTNDEDGEQKNTDRTADVTEIDRKLEKKLWEPYGGNVDVKL
ncbi:MAG: hypothetical protein K6G45_08425 [Lachnospiraceae bacterium]|nr:hypothetical protein [Lachnospiraceae bacterium]